VFARWDACSIYMPAAVPAGCAYECLMQPCAVLPICCWLSSGRAVHKDPRRRLLSAQIFTLVFSLIIMVGVGTRTTKPTSVYNFMSDFKTFVKENIDYIVSHFRRRALLLRFDGSPLSEINLSFDSLSDEYLQMEEPPTEQIPHNEQIQKAGSLIRIEDHDLLPLLDNLDEEWSGKLNLADQNTTDQTILRLAALLKEERCSLTGLDFSGNRRITFIGAIALADALRNNSIVKKLLLNGITLEREGAKYQLIISAAGSSN